MNLSLLIRWNPTFNPSNMEAHKEIADKWGSTWWGLLGATPELGMPAEKWNEVYAQVVSGTPTHLYFVGITGLWRANVVDITSDPAHVDRAMVPAYYDPEWQPAIWLRLSNFVQANETESEARNWANKFCRLSDSGRTPDFTTLLTVFVVNEVAEIDFLTQEEPPPRLGGSSRNKVEFNADTLSAYLEDKNLLLERHIVSAMVAALTAGKHVILTGPPGTGKTTFAELTSEHAARTGLCTGHMLTTATSDWTTFETIGGLVPDQDDGNLTFRPGHFLVAARNERWLIIDELNRSNFDRAFGQLFSVLSGQSVVLPYNDPRGRPYAINAPRTLARYDAVNHHAIDISDAWRIIATMNVFDKTLLFEMSFALMRRFVFIEVPSPPEETFRTLWLQRMGGLSDAQRDGLDGVLTGLYRLRQMKDLGPATFIDMAAFATRLVAESPTFDTGAVAFQLFYSFMLPQFEGIDRVTAQRLYTMLVPLVGESRLPRLRVVLEEVLGVVVDPTAAAAAIARESALAEQDA